MNRGVADIVDMFATYGATIGRGIGDMPISSTDSVIPDPTFFFGESACPPGYHSDGRGSCVMDGIGPTPPPGYMDPNLFCPAGTYAAGAKPDGTPNCIANAVVPAPGSSTTPRPASTGGGTAAAGTTIFGLTTNQLVIGLSIVLLVILLMGSAKR